MLIQIKKSSNISNKAQLKAEQDKITKLETFDSNYFRIKSYFEGDGTQNYLVFCSDPTPRNSLFGAAKLVKNVNIGKYKYSGYGIGFDTKGIFLFPISGLGKDVIIFAVYMSSSVHVDNKKKYILILGEDPTQGLDDTRLAAEKKHSISFLTLERDFVLACIIMEQIRIYL